MAYSKWLIWWLIYETKFKDMSKITRAILGLQKIDKEAGRNREKSRIHPAFRIFTTIVYIFIVMSFDRYKVIGLLSMFVYPLIMSLIYEISLIEAFKRMRYVLMLVFVLGIFNPIFNSRTFLSLYGFKISYGMISMVSLYIKSTLSVLALYIMIMQTGSRGFYESLLLLRIKREVALIFMLMYRYLIVILVETEKMVNAYKLRAPGQKGINIKAWGSFGGLLLLRSIDRSKYVYESMSMRGYGKNSRSEKIDDVNIAFGFLYVILWMLIFGILRYTNFVYLVGSIINLNG